MTRVGSWVAIATLAACGGSGDGARTDTSTTTGDTSSETTTTAGTTSVGESSSSAAATSSSGSLGGSDGTSSETGEPGWTVSTARITDQNRHYVEMHGGWGPQLRAPMRDPDGTAWFVLDRGEDVLHNRSIVYVREDGDAWAEVASQAHTPGVQQNAASVMQAGTIHTYAIDVDSHWLTHCTFETQSASAGGCNAIAIGGPYLVPEDANYVGAALAPDPAHLVWFTIVGDAGGAGQLVYTYDYGGGWNGPVVTQLPGFNDIGYVFAAFTAPSHAVMVGQTFTGVYPTGTYDAVVVELDFGEPAQLFVLGAGGGVDVRSGADIWVDPGSGAVHVLAETDAGLGYWFRPAGAAWTDHLLALELVPDTFRGRFAVPPGGPLALARGSATTGGLELRIAATSPDQPASWADAEAVALPIPVAGFDAPSAIYAAGPSYQDDYLEGPTRALGRFHVAACGRYQSADAEIWQVQVH